MQHPNFVLCQKDGLMRLILLSWTLGINGTSEISAQTFPDREIKSNIETSKDLFLFLSLSLLLL